MVLRVACSRSRTSFTRNGLGLRELPRNRRACGVHDVAVHARAARYGRLCAAARAGRSRAAAGRRSAAFGRCRRRWAGQGGRARRCETPARSPSPSWRSRVAQGRERIVACQAQHLVRAVELLLLGEPAHGVLQHFRATGADDSSCASFAASRPLLNGCVAMESLERGDDLARAARRTRSRRLRGRR